MIIGISGKIGSGKDTVGKIIQYLLIKNQGYDMIWTYFNDNNLVSKKGAELYSNWEIKKFAGKLKEIVSTLTGISVEDLEKEEVKNRLLGEEWRIFFFREKVNGIRIPKSFYGIHNNVIEAYETIEGMNHLDIATEIITVRQLLQKVGTEAMRNVIHPNIWVNALFADYRINFEAETVEEWGKDLVQNWIITDMRFPNEMKAVVERKGITIRVVKPIENYPENPNFNGDMQIAVKMAHNHSSETALDNAKFDYEIDNNGTIEELIEKVKEILIKEKII